MVDLTFELAKERERKATCNLHRVGSAVSRRSHSDRFAVSSVLKRLDKPASTVKRRK